MNKSVAAVSAHVLLLTALLLLCAGVAWLESGRNSLAWGYGAALFGAALFVFLPSRCSFPPVLRSEWACLMLASLGGTIFHALHVFSLSNSFGDPGPFPLFPAWGSAIALLVFASFCADRVLRVEYRVPKGAIFTMSLIFLVALLVRSCGLKTLVGDEFIHTHYLMRMIEQPKPIVLEVMGNDAYPFCFIYLQALLSQAVAPLVDPVSLQKCISLACAALSVTFWYVVVRVRSGASTALYGSILLVFFGWHWINSGFIYAYPPDLALVSFGIMACVVALRCRSFVWAALAGCAIGATIWLQKVGVLLAPVVCYLFLESLISATPQERRRLFGLLAVSAAGAIVCCGPFLLQMLNGRNMMPLHELAARNRAEVFAKAGLTRATAIVFMFEDAFRQLQRVTHDFPRHIFRMHAPILDPVFSILFSVGFVGCVFSLRRSAVARFCLLGLFLFVLPMAVSFPLNDASRGLARRMLGISLFLAWIGALGAEIVARKLATPQRAHRVATVLCLLSAATNIWFFNTRFTPQHAGDSYAPTGGGLQSRAMIDLALEAELRRIPAVALEGHHATLLGMPDSSVRKLSTLTAVATVDEVRPALAKNPGVVQLVIIPWDSKANPRDSRAVVEALADIVPPYLWIPGREDYDGIPMVRYAFVRAGNS